VLFLNNPKEQSAKDRRRVLDAVRELNQTQFNTVGDPEITTRISQYEMAYRMQTSVPGLMDITQENKATLDMYGPDVARAGSFTHSAILARRLIERGTRVVQILHRGWDQHNNLPKLLRGQMQDTDQACAALVMDLKERGLLDDTLVVWGGEFGRTPMVEASVSLGRSMGRDHHPQAFSMWLAGGGIKGGVTLGATDEMGFNIVEDEVHVADLHATILHCLGIDHERLTFSKAGLDFKLTGVDACRYPRAAVCRER